MAASAAAPFPDKTETQMRKRLIIAAVVLLALAGAGGTYGWDWYTEGRFFETTDNATISSDIVAIAPKVPGRIVSLPVSDNQTVRAGDTLMVIDDADYRASLEQAEAALHAAQAAVEVVDGNIALASGAIEEAKASLASAQAEKTRADHDLARYEKLNASQYASRQKFQTAQADASKAKADVTRAQAALTVERSRLTLLAAQRKQAEAEVERAAATVESARIKLADTVVRAPVDGIVGNKGVQIGQFVQAAQQAMSVVPTDEIYIVANFKETQLAHVRTGQPVKFSVDTYGDERTFHGVVDSLSPGSGAVFSLLPPDNATGNFTKIVQRIPVKIRLQPEDQQALLLPGMSVVVRVDTRGFDPHAGNAQAFAPRRDNAPRVVQR